MKKSNKKTTANAKEKQECKTCYGVGKLRDGDTNFFRKCADCRGTGRLGPYTSDSNKSRRSAGPKLHILKCWPDAFDAVYIGLKHHEIRVDDRNYKVGDHLLLKYWDPKTKKYGKKSIQVEVAYKTNGGEWGLPKKLCVMSIQHIDVNNTRLCCAMLHPSFVAK